MADPLHTDTKVLHANAHDYARLLVSAAEGHALWRPTSVSQAGRLGDAGQIVGGRFFKYFNVLETHLVSGLPRFRFNAQNDAKYILEPETTDNIDILKSQHDIRISLGFDAEATAPPAEVDISVDADVVWQKSELAFLKFLGPNRTEEEFSYALILRIRRYLADNDAGIRAALDNLRSRLAPLERVGVACRKSSQRPAQRLPARGPSRPVAKH
ncbi:hypothetical protein AURDEDRAFT_111728 [Auricularia subglabra TFB-10046 SS5]|nr:hypothetical protein AURDEDRAFT_111728 [Auricularia subglabra TFB-10046 SS5]